MRSTPGHGEILSYYDFGRTTVQVCAADPRFSYCAYVPESYDEAGDRRYRLLVVVHGTMRDNVLGLTVVLADGSVIRTGTRARTSPASPRPR